MFSGYRRLTGGNVAAIGNTDLPWAPRARTWDAPAARTRVARWASSDDSGDKTTIDWAKYARAFLYRDPAGARDDLGTYALPFADVIDGELRAVYAAIASATAYLDRVKGMNPTDRSHVAAELRRLYASAADAFDDSGIKAPPTLLRARSEEAPVSTVSLPWSGPIAPYETLSLDGWVIAAMGDPKRTGLPLPLKFQRSTAPGHDNAIVGLAKITEVWTQDQMLYARGEFDAWDPEAVLLAHKAKHGFVGQVSVDMGDCTVSKRTVQGRTVHYVEDWTLMSATLCADPKFAAARITAGDLATAEAKGTNQVLAASVSAAFTFTGAMTERVDFSMGDPDALLTDPAELYLPAPATVIDLAASTTVTAPPPAPAAPETVTTTEPAPAAVTVDTTASAPELTAEVTAPAASDDDSAPPAAAPAVPSMTDRVKAARDRLRRQGAKTRLALLKEQVNA
jgi:hypothetical protein